jgi:phytoene dehydrogenase-like protein
VHVIEGAETPGAGCRTEELTLPGFWHDVCSAVHPLASASPFFAAADLPAHGRAAAVQGSVDQTAGGFGSDGRAYRQLLLSLVRDVELTLPDILAPLGRSLPGRPLAMARFGLEGLPPGLLRCSIGGAGD